MSVYKQALNAGFDARVNNNVVIISLSNRSVNTMEVSEALDIPQLVCTRYGDSVVVPNVDFS